MDFLFLSKVLEPVPLSKYMKCLILYYEILYTTVSDEETYLTLKEVLEHIYDQEIHCSYHTLQYLEVTNTIE